MVVACPVGISGFGFTLGICQFLGLLCRSDNAIGTKCSVSVLPMAEWGSAVLGYPTRSSCTLGKTIPKNF